MANHLHTTIASGFHNPAPWSRLNVASPRDTLKPDVTFACRKHFEALKAELESICYAADVDLKADPEAFEFFTDGCDNAFTIDWPTA